MLSIIKHRQIIEVKATYIKYNFNVITFQTQAIPDFIPKLLVWVYLVIYLAFTEMFLIKV